MYQRVEIEVLVKTKEIEYQKGCYDPQETIELNMWDILKNKKISIKEIYGMRIRNVTLNIEEHIILELEN